MQENTTIEIPSTNKSEKLLFLLDVKTSHQIVTSVEVSDQLIAGIDPRNDLILIDPKVKTKHFLFRLTNNTLTVHNLGEDGDSFLNGLALEMGKLYILEKGDSLTVGKIEIKIRAEINHYFFNNSSFVSQDYNEPLTEKFHLKNRPTKEVVEDKKAEIKKAEIKKAEIKKAEIKKAENQKTRDLPLSNLNKLAFVPYKMYGFLIDVVLTYFILTYALPKIGIEEQVQNFLYPISKYLLQIKSLTISQLIAHHISLIEFFIIFHTFMITSALVLGSSPGFFLIGMGHKGKNNFLAIRFKAYFYALLNFFVLPFVIFDIPIYKGRNLKELLTFSEMELSSSLLFKILRKAVIPVLLFAGLFSPFFTNHPTNSSLTIDTLHKEKYIDPHTFFISSFSAEFGFSLQGNLNKDYALLPSFEKNKLGIIFYDKKNNLFLTMKEVSRIDNDHTSFRFRYANPFASYLSTKGLSKGKDLKNKSLLSLELSVDHLSSNFKNFGPFFGNGLLFKKFLSGPLNSKDSLLYNVFTDQNPVLKILNSSHLQSKQEKVLLFTTKGIIEFSLDIPKQPNLRENFVSSVLAPMRFNQPSLKKAPTNPQVFEILDAFERSEYQTILTYYINEAKKAQESNNPKWQFFLKKNLIETKIALFVEGTHLGLTKSIENSFDDIINKL